MFFEHLAEVPLGDGDVFMKVLHTALFREVDHSVPFPSKDPFGGQKPLQTHWTSGMNAGCADTNLSTCKSNIQPLTLLS